MTKNITLSAEMVAVLVSYNNAYNRQTHVVYIKDESDPYSGVSATFVEFDKMGRMSRDNPDGSPIVTLQRANGMLFSVPLSSVFFRVMA